MKSAYRFNSERAYLDSRRVVIAPKAGLETGIEYVVRSSHTLRSAGYTRGIKSAVGVLSALSILASTVIVGSTSVAALPPAPDTFDLITNIDADYVSQQPGGAIGYEASIENRGPNDVSDVTWEIWVAAAASLSNPVCTATGGAVCPIHPVGVPTDR